MRKTFKRTMTIFCVVVLLLAACTSGQEAENKSESSSANGGVTGGDGEDRSVTSSKKRGHITVMVYDRGRIPAEEGTYENNRWTKWINEHSPVDVTFVPIPRNKPEEKLNVLFASGSAPDLIVEYSTDNRNAWFSSKQIQPIDEAVEQYSTEYKALLEKYPVLRKLGTRSDGKMYDIGFVTGQLDVNWVYLVRADWLRALNLDVPETVEELFQVAKAMTEQDPDGNNKDDTYGMGLAGHFNNKAVDFMFGNPISGYHVIEDDQLEFGWAQLQAAAEFKKRLYEAGIVDVDFVADSNGEKLKNDFVNGKVGFYSAQRADLLPILEAIQHNDPSAELIPIPYPKSPYGQFSPPIGVPAQVVGVVNSTAKDLESVMKYVDFLSQEETVKTLKWGIEGEHYNLNDRKCPVPIDAEKNQREIGWYGDYSILSSLDPIKHCDPALDSLSPDVPADQSYKSIIETARTLYLTEERPIPGYTSAVYVPSLPTELQMIQDTFKIDELLKSVITPDYEPEAAVQNLQEIWKQAGGIRIDDWYRQWYEENKDTAILIKDIYNMVD